MLAAASDVMWLDPVNAGLALLVLIGSALLARVVFAPVGRPATRPTTRPDPSDPHALTTRELGIAMADGGERVDVSEGY